MTLRIRDTAPVKVTNETGYPTRRVAAVVRWALRDVEAEHVDVTVREGGAHVSGHYAPYWYPSKGQSREQIRAKIPDRFPSTYHPYDRRDAPAPFELETWEEALVAIVAHEGKHHVQTPRHAYGSYPVRRNGQTHKRRAIPRYREQECDWAAYRAVLRWREAQR